MLCKLAVAFLSGRAYPLNFQPPFFLRSISTLIYVGVNISLNNSSSLSFLNVYAPLFVLPPTDGRTDSFSPSRNLFILGDFNCHHPLSDSRGLSDPRKEEVFDWVIYSDLPLNDPDKHTLLHRSSGSRSFPDIPLLPPHLRFLAPGRCFRTWVLTTSQFFYLSLSLQFFAPTSVLLPSIFRKLIGMTLSPTLTSTVFLQRDSLFLSSAAAALFTSLVPNVAKSSIPFGRIKRHPKAWWILKLESHLSCFPFSSAQFLAAGSYLSSSTATGPDKAAYPMLKHLPRSGMDFLLHIFNLSWTLHSFPSIWKTSSIIPHTQDGKASRLSCFLLA